VTVGLLSQGVPDVECCRLDEYRETHSCLPAQFHLDEKSAFVEMDESIVWAEFHKFLTHPTLSESGTRRFFLS